MEKPNNPEQFLENIDVIFLANLNALRMLSNIDLPEITFSDSDKRILRTALLSTLDGLCDLACIASGKEPEKLSFDIVQTATPPIC